jgi:uncharacterized protein YecT (DUF1311 family)
MYVLVVGCLTASVPVFCQRNAEAEGCFSLDGQAAALACLETRYQVNEVALREQEAGLDKVIVVSEESVQAQRRIRAALQESARAFRRYRSKQCDLQATLGAGGSGGPHRRLMCAIELDEQRTKHLHEIQTSIR